MHRMNVNITDTTTVNDGFQIVKSKKSLKKKKLVSSHTEIEKCTSEHTSVPKGEGSTCSGCMLTKPIPEEFVRGKTLTPADKVENTGTSLSRSCTEKHHSPNKKRVYLTDQRSGETIPESSRVLCHTMSRRPPDANSTKTEFTSQKSFGNIKTPQEISQNKKRVLCYSYVTQGECPYGIKCVYAHSIKEQNIDPLRKKVYDILDNNVPLNDIDFVHDNDLYKTFLQLTRTCYGCENNTCVGGYNCKKGAIDLRHTICYDDLYSGECQYGNTCDKIHLTKRRLVPKTIQLLIMTGYTDSDKNAYVKKLMSMTHSAFTMPIEKVTKYDGKHDDTLSIDSCDSLDTYSSDEDDISKTSVGEHGSKIPYNKYILTLQPI